ncbi:COMF operon protein 3 [Companilactobacillus mindensis DSM 14500]|uniref:COMF operon protein 3 n=1 Tax=Companilactobacillus mindensis DSM 14500 TaxID=1423770 RepID=A0A0R1QPR6_9LACO|nr:ComF family protein [Companilactobacillus mindensis]KRL43171.1 COMF operon protein 3 [Companilactobacillus mindensis DSM 14500]
MKCLNCGNDIANNLQVKEIFLFNEIPENYICNLCRSQLAPLANRNNCPRCFKPEINGICDDCKMWEQKYQIINCHQALFEYNQFIHNYFKLYKRYGDVLLAKLFYQDIKNWSLKNHFDVVTYIPASQSHLQIRGFDPVYELYADIFDLQPLLTKVDSDKPQAQKNRLERLRTPQTFSPLPAMAQIQKNQSILILDDIYTTGRTLMHAHDIFFKANFKKITTFSLSR